ncbi:hypothetical protein CCH79_00020582 [Gambusia affinis]|uniref:Uncharacterized protein n=1 Tax=Gambusia affinis TaxID=33528 RepID=A0A315W334_GAMAF|nr:hypothetical protein CCH79_00020582 [Gambusia affinis]
MPSVTDNPYTWRVFFIVAGDFNQANMKTVLPNFHQHVEFMTREENTLDLVSTNIKKAFRATPHLHLDTYPVVKKVRAWPEGALSALQDCFECTDWGMFREATMHKQHMDMEEYAASVSNNIQ